MRLPVAGLAIGGGLLALSGGEALAHVHYHDLDQAPTPVTATFSGSPISDPCATKLKGCQSSNGFTRFGWLKGTEPLLGDSHQLTADAEFWKFHLDQTSPVVITFRQGQAGLDPAISLYRGLLPDMAHDDTPVDPLNPGDVNGCGVLSPVDGHAAPYAYLPHDGYRDTKDGSTTGGISGCRPINRYLGQFDAFASWSLANFGGQWSEIRYVASISGTLFTGNDQGSHLDGNHLAVAGTGETLAITLPPGDYTIAAGGEACSAAVTTCQNPRLYGTVTFRVGLPTDPPDPGADAGPIGPDAGNGPAESGDGHGGGCSSSGLRERSPWTLAMVALVMLVVGRERRSRRRGRGRQRLR